MKVLWMQEKLGAFGGAEANVLATAAALSKRGHTNCLAYIENTGLAEEPWQEAFEESCRVGGPDDLCGLADRLRPDAVWIHNWPESASFGRLMAGGFAAGRMVHDHALYCLRHYKYHPLTRRNCTRPASAACIFPCLAFLQRGHGRFPVRIASLGAKMREIRDNRALQRAVVASGFMRGELIKNGFDSRRIRVLAPVPPDPAAEKPDAGNGMPGPDWVAGRILFIGQVIRGKGVDLLLKALHGLPGEWEFSLAGRGSALPVCKKLIAELGLEKRVTIHGHLSPKELSRQYREAQIVVVPSAWQEPFGMVGIEAMRHARPVVAFSVGGIPDWLRDGHNGRLVPSGDIDVLRETLRGMLGNPGECQRMGEDGWKLSRGEFSFSGYIDRLEAFLGDLSSESRLSPAVGGAAP